MVRGSMQLHLSVTGQHTPLSPALCFNYFSLFSLPLSLLPSHPVPLFSCDYTREGGYRGGRQGEAGGTTRCRDEGERGVSIGRQVEPRGFKGQDYNGWYNNLVHLGVRNWSFWSHTCKYTAVFYINTSGFWYSRYSLSYTFKSLYSLLLHVVEEQT